MVMVMVKVKVEVIVMAMVKVVMVMVMVMYLYSAGFFAFITLRTFALYFALYATPQRQRREHELAQ